MTAVRNKDTSLEMAFRHYIWSHGIRGYRVRTKLVGHPDLVFRGLRIAVFIDGCLWHGCPVCCESPRTHGEFWSNKIRQNTKRDRQVDQKLAQEGWEVLRFWGHEVESDPEGCRVRLVGRLAETTQRKAVDATLLHERRLCAVDLFCGAGGATVGLREAGFEVLGALDMDPLAVETYRKNNLGTDCFHADIRSLEPADLMRQLGLRPGTLDLLAGCPPCQGFSSVRTLNGSRKVDDDRNGLLLRFADYVVALQPRSVMLENVVGLQYDWRFREFLAILQRRGMDYKPTYGVLNAADYGVPQRRRRLILVAGHHFEIPLAKPTGMKRTVRDAIGDMPPVGMSGDALHDFPEHHGPRVKELIRKIPHDGGSLLQAGKKYQLQCHVRCNGFKDVYGRLAWDEVAPTITSGCTNPSKGRFIHPEENRALTLREAALIQTFPREYSFSLCGGKQGVARLIGNALPPGMILEQARLVAEALRESEGAKSDKGTG